MSTLESVFLVQKGKQLWLTLTAGMSVVVCLICLLILGVGLPQLHHLPVYEDSHRVEASSSGPATIPKL